MRNTVVKLREANKAGSNNITSFLFRWSRNRARGPSKLKGPAIKERVGDKEDESGEGTSF
jgi:hypothetical protein